VSNETHSGGGPYSHSWDTYSGPDYPEDNEAKMNKGEESPQRAETHNELRERIKAIVERAKSKTPCVDHYYCVISDLEFALANTEKEPQ
jgi:hypothetical protein